MFAADVLRRDRQCILVVCEYVSSNTIAQFIPSEKGSDISDALVIMTSSLVPLEGPPAVVRTYPDPGILPIIADPILRI